MQIPDLLLNAMNIQDKKVFCVPFNSFFFFTSKHVPCLSFYFIDTGGPLYKFLSRH